MAEVVGEVFGNRPRRRRALSEKLRIVELTLEPGASVAQIARENGVNANQLFGWRRAFERGELFASGSTALLPVTVSAASESATQQITAREEASSGSIHIELPGGRLISAERGADPALLRLVFECLHR